MDFGSEVRDRARGWAQSWGRISTQNGPSKIVKININSTKKSKNTRVSLAERNERNAPIRQQILPFDLAVGDEGAAAWPSAPPNAPPAGPETQHSGCTRIITTHKMLKRYLVVCGMW